MLVGAGGSTVDVPRRVYPAGMALALPQTLSPSKVSAFKDCALAFRFSVIDRLPEPPSPAAVKGTLVHRALEQLYCADPPARTLSAALSALGHAFDHARGHDGEYRQLGLDSEAEELFRADAEHLVHRYFQMEDPARVRPIGIELMLEARLGGVRVRGIIDRLELDAEGGLVVTDYKTGRSPAVRYEQGRFGGVHFYAFLCEAMLGRRPARVQLLYLGDGVTIVATPSEQSVRGLANRVAAVWQAVERACATHDFRPHPGPLCDWCAYQAYCPAFGGDPSLAQSTEPVLAGV